MATRLIQNGRVWDGNCFFYGDIFTENDKIAEIAPRIDRKADFVYDATGKTVTAGMVDAHIHMRVVAGEPYGIPPEIACFPFGVTAAADAGRVKGEPAVFDAFQVKNVVFPTALIRGNEPNFSKLEETIARFGDKVVGVKVYFDASLCEVTDITPLAKICAFAKERGLRVMVHCAHSPTPMAEILETLNPGDLLTHAFHGAENNAAEDDFVSMKAAQARGVLIDTGFAANFHTDYRVFRAAIEAGVIPDTISTDITKSSAFTRGGRYGLTMAMSMARHMGMQEEDIFRAVTTTPAKALGREAWGRLTEGSCADLAVLEYTDEGFAITDHAGNTIESQTGYRCALTLADGWIVYRK